MEIRKLKSNGVTLEFFCNSEERVESIQRGCLMYFDDECGWTDRIDKEYNKTDVNGSNYDELILAILSRCQHPKIASNRLELMNAYIDYIREEQFSYDWHEYRRLYEELTAQNLFIGDQYEIDFDRGGLHDPAFGVGVDSYPPEYEEFRRNSWNNRIEYLFWKWGKPEVMYRMEEFIFHSGNRRLEYFKELNFNFNDKVDPYAFIYR